MLKNILLFISLSLLSACASTPTIRAQQVIATDNLTVTNCKFLGGVFGESIFAFTEMGISGAKNEALDRAAYLGATHLVWTSIEGRWHPIAAGRAYRCL